MKARVDVPARRAEAELLTNDVVRDVQGSSLSAGDRANLVARVRRIRDIAIELASAAASGSVR